MVPIFLFVPGNSGHPASSAFFRTAYTYKASMPHRSDSFYTNIFARCFHKQKRAENERKENILERRFRKQKGAQN